MNTALIPCAYGATVKARDTEITHTQNLFIQELSHGKNKGKFVDTIRHILWNWSRGWWVCPPHSIMREKNPALWAKFDKVNN